jgi:4-amino-4-deoxy-L-arabinose transferase-like glycosyltransferase
VTPPADEPLPRLGALDALLLVALGGAAALAILPALGAHALASWDEATYGALVREFLKHPRLTLVYNTSPYFEKPPFGVWLMALSVRALGLDEFALRLPVALLGIASVLLTYICGRRAALLALPREPGAAASASLAGALAALLLLGVPHFVAWSRIAMLDVPLVAIGLLAVALLLYADGRPGLTLASGATVGVAVMTKWIAGFLFVPGLLAIVVARRGARALLARDVLGAAALCLAIFLPWHVEQQWVHGRAFFDTYVVWNTIKRMNLQLELHTGGPLYYVRMYLYNAGPLAFVHAGGVALALVLARRGARMVGALAALALGAFALVNCMSTKIGWYLAPVYPGAALATAVALATVAGRRRAPVLAAACGGALLLATGLPPAFHGGIEEGRDGFVESYNVVDWADEIKDMRGSPPFERRVPLLYVHEASEPAAHYYLADEVEVVDDRHFEWLAEPQSGPFMCLTYGKFADEMFAEHPGSGVEVFARRDPLVVIGRR